MITGTGVAEFFGAGIFIALLALGVRSAWTLTCWIAEHKQRRPEPPALTPDQLQEIALLDEHLTTYADSIQALYPTGDQQQ